MQNLCLTFIQFYILTRKFFLSGNARGIPPVRNPVCGVSCLWGTPILVLAGGTPVLVLAGGMGVTPVLALERGCTPVLGPDKGTPSLREPGTRGQEVLPPPGKDPGPVSRGTPLLPVDRHTPVKQYFIILRMRTDYVITVFTPTIKE